MPTTTTAQLRGRYHDETCHTDHVTRAAVRLFDRLHHRLGIPAQERRLLEAASLLHDVGFSVGGKNHAGHSARIVLDNKIGGFTAQERRVIAGAILLHQLGERSWSDPMLAGLPNSPRARRIGALLRLADGLDHSHAQDCTIRKIGVRAGFVRIAVHSPWYAGNAATARHKSDLWNEVFTTPVVIDERGTAGPLLFSGVVREGGHRLEVLRRILYSQYRAIADSRESAIEGTGPESLHDLRVSLRRFRVALRLFRRELKGSSAPQLDRMLSALTAQLSPLRDTDVWLGFLQRRATRSRMTNRDWNAYREFHEKRQGEALRDLRTVLQGARFRSFYAVAPAFLRTELPLLIRGTEPGSFAAFAAERLPRVFKRLKKHGPLKRTSSQESLHELRKIVRRERYFVEFTAPLYGRKGERLVAVFKRLTATLGGCHDMDVFLERMAADPVRAPKGLVLYVRAVRKDNLERFRKAWKIALEKRLRKAVLRSVPR